MDNHPIQGLMRTVMESMKEMVDVNTIVGDAVETPDGSVIMPISKMAFGYAAGGSEFAAKAKSEGAGHPFGGGSGAGVSVQPVGFLVVGNGNIRMLPVDANNLVDRVMDLTPQLINQVQGLVSNRKAQKQPSAAPMQFME